MPLTTAAALLLGLLGVIATAPLRSSALHTPGRDLPSRLPTKTLRQATPPAGPQGVNPPKSHPRNDLSWLFGTILAVAVVILLVVFGMLLWSWWRGRGRAAAPAPAMPATDVRSAVAAAADKAVVDLDAGTTSDSIVRCWVALQHAVHEAGVDLRPEETPAEFVDRLHAAARLPDTPLRVLAGLYREARFSSHPMSETQRTAARDAYGELAATLSRRPVKSTGAIS